MRNIQYGFDLDGLSWSRVVIPLDLLTKIFTIILFPIFLVVSVQDQDHLGCNFME